MASGGKHNGGDRLTRFREVVRDRNVSLEVLWTQFESQPGGELADKLSRELHTLKGEAGLMGYEQLEALVHALEDLVLAARGLAPGGAHARRPGATEAFNDLRDLFTSGLDHIQPLADGDPGERPSTATALIEQIRGTLALAGPGETDGGDGGDDGNGDDGDGGGDDGNGDDGDGDGDGEAHVSGDSARVPVAIDEAPTPPADSARQQVETPPALKSYAVRVNPRHLDRMRDIIGELLLARTRLATSAASLQIQREGGITRGRSHAHDDVLRSIEAQLRDDVLRMGNLVTALDEVTRELRMVSISVLFQRYPRAVRAMSRDLGRRVQLVSRGEAVEADREVLEALDDPLVQLVRNALDHGIEPPDARLRAGKSPVGTLSLSASVIGDSLHVSITDDGAGIDVDKIRQLAVDRGLIDPTIAPTLPESTILQCLFASGLSTRREVTSMSGRGFGLDIVARTIRSLGGTVEISSELGVGTTFHIVVPIRAAITSVLLFRVGGGRYAIPTSSLVAIEDRDDFEVADTLDGPAIEYQGALVPLVSLVPILQETSVPVGVEGTSRVIIARHGGGLVGLEDSRDHAQREAVLKSAGAFFSEDKLISAGLALEDGSVALVINTDDVYRMARGHTRALPAVAPDAPPRSRTVLVAEDSPLVRGLIVDALRAHGLTVIEAVDGKDALDKLHEHDDIQLLVTDVEMPRMDGLKLIARMRATSRRRIPAIVVSTRGSDEDKLAAVQVGADHYLVKKDFSSEGLWTIVSRFLA